jgi:hypothetical protein
MALEPFFRLAEKPTAKLAFSQIYTTWVVVYFRFEKPDRMIAVVRSLGLVKHWNNIYTSFSP